MKHKATLLMILSLAMSACAAPAVEATAVEIEPQVETVDTISDDNTLVSYTVNDNEISTLSGDYDDDDLDDSANVTAFTEITLENNSVSIKGDGATAGGSIVTITAGGRYRLSGNLDDGQVVVDSSDDSTVFLVLNNASITSLSDAPIVVKNAGKVVLTLASATSNSLTDGATRTENSTDSEPANAVIYSNDDLTINGSGALTINALYKHGIVSNDDLKVTGGNIVVSASGDGMRGKDSIAIGAGSILITAGGDGMQAYDTEDAEKGTFVIDGGTIQITSAQDGIQAETILSLNNGEISILAGGGAVNTSHTFIEGGMDNRGGMMPGEADTSQESDSESMKGLKAGDTLIITDGTISIDSADDALHSNNEIIVEGGDIQIDSGDDGLRANNTITINNGVIYVASAYEGIESENTIINGGDVTINASDDGINGTSDSASTDGASELGQMPQAEVNATNLLTINGGSVLVNAYGDGLDINGGIVINGGIILVDGPSTDRESGIDFTTLFEVSEGSLIATSSAGMAMVPSEGSTQNSLGIIFEQIIPSGTTLEIIDATGKVVASASPSKNYQAVVVSSPALELGETYEVLIGGSSYTSVTISSTVTTIGNFMVDQPMEGGGGRGGGQRPPDGQMPPAGGMTPPDPNG